jgi:hypothetical protein
MVCETLQAAMKSEPAVSRQFLPAHGNHDCTQVGDGYETWRLLVPNSKSEANSIDNDLSELPLRPVHDTGLLGNLFHSDGQRVSRVGLVKHDKKGFPNGQLRHSSCVIDDPCDLPSFGHPLTGALHGANDESRRPNVRSDTY